ncbi:MAG: FAD:protein FMN transferase, partial [Phycisphaerae bacterium]|nr:FAD:protein FMN transferase [Phycisphaerae bacterium]
ITITEDGVIKTTDTASLDLGGVAKGYGIDRAVEAMIQAGCRGGLIDVGGDIRCFGRSAWTVAVRDPFGRTEPVAVLRLRGGAVCTSGNYERYYEIAGRRYSHIIDPRTGRPVDFAPSVTVVAPAAMTADAWATALSVLGVDGLALLGEDSGIEAMIVVGTPDSFEVYGTKGFEDLTVPGSLKAEFHACEPH